MIFYYFSKCFTMLKCENYMQFSLNMKIFFQKKWWKATFFGEKFICSENFPGWQRFQNVSIFLWQTVVYHSIELRILHIIIFWRVWNSSQVFSKNKENARQFSQWSNTTFSLEFHFFHYGIFFTKVLYSEDRRWNSQWQQLKITHDHPREHIDIDKMKKKLLQTLWQNISEPARIYFFFSPYRAECSTLRTWTFRSNCIICSLSRVI